MRPMQCFVVPPITPTNSSNFVPCPHCYGHYERKQLWKHSKYVPVRITTGQLRLVKLFRSDKNSLNSGTSATLYFCLVCRISSETFCRLLSEYVACFAVFTLNIVQNVDLNLHNCFTEAARTAVSDKNGLRRHSPFLFSVTESR